MQQTKANVLILLPLTMVGIIIEATVAAAAAIEVGVVAVAATN